MEAFKFKKRDYDWGFGHLDYENTPLTANFYYRNYGIIPFDRKVSEGKYLAGDVGSTIEFSRTFQSGVRFGAFATFTDVSNEDFGEGSSAQTNVRAQVCRPRAAFLDRRR